MGINLSGVRVALISLGCDKNLVDGEVMLGLVTQYGGILTNNCEKADVIVVNTCGFISDASQESVNAIMDAVEFKKRGVGVCKVVIVSGCFAERYKDDIFDELPGVDAVVGANKHGEIVDVICTVLGTGKAQPVSVYGRDDGCFYGERVVSTRHYAYLKIAEGCDNHCTYCSIPVIRGAYRSRTIEALLEEAEVLANGGAKEIILVAQDTSCYGTDIYGENKLAELLRGLSKTDNIKRIRLLYCYPQHITDELIDEMAANPKVAKYIDMPIQHAADSVLKRMGRKNIDIKALVAKLREKMPQIAIRTTLITGFPGETDEEFNNLLEFVKELKFDRLGVFAYSREEGTPADKMAGHLPKKVKEYRKNKVMELQQKISTEKLKEKIGMKTHVLIEGKTEDDMFYGCGHMDAPNIDGVVFVASENELAAGEFVAVTITGSLEYDLEGTVANELAE